MVWWLRPKCSWLNVNWPHFCVRGHDLTCHHALVGSPGSLVRGGVSNYGAWRKTVVNSYSNLASPNHQRPMYAWHILCTINKVKPLSEPMMVRLPTHTCFTRPQWVDNNFKWEHFSHSSSHYYYFRQFLLCNIKSNKYEYSHAACLTTYQTRNPMHIPWSINVYEYYLFHLIQYHQQNNHMHTFQYRIFLYNHR